MERTVTEVKFQITKMEDNDINLQANLPKLSVHVTGLECNVIMLGGRISSVQ
jgi:hypothetical protein